MNIAVSFPGGGAVEADLDGHRVRTDQPLPWGDDSAPAPFELFLASIATCMGYYALRFCQVRKIATEGLRLSLETVDDGEKKRLGAIEVALTLPPGFPGKYKEAIGRAVDECAVRKHMTEPPAFKLTVNTEAAQPGPKSPHESARRTRSVTPT